MNRALTPQRKPLGAQMKKFRYIYLMLIPVVAYYVIFHYASMFYAVVAFQDYKPLKGITGSAWVGLENFRNFFTGVYFWRLVRNTLLLNVYQILFGFPMPILFALMVNEMADNAGKRIVQTITYMPHFIALVVVCGLLSEFSLSTGLFNDVLAIFGFERTNLLSRPEYFRTIYVASGIWQSIGWGSIIYLATLSGVDRTLHEAAALDGAGRIRRIIHVNLPALMPVIIVQLIMRLGHIMSQGYEKVILLYSPVTYETADIISSYVFRRGLLDMDYSFGAAVGIFNSVINLVFLIGANYFSRRTNGTSLW